MMTFEELHKKTLPEHKKASVKIDFVSYYLWRPICDFLSILLIGKIEATTVTIISFYACIISLACFSLKIGVAGALLGYFFLWVWNIADGIDGNIARYTDTCSKSGDLWDAVAGYAAMIVFYLGAGLVAAHEDSIFLLSFMKSEDYVLMGAVAAICMVFPRLATQKKQAVYGAGASAAFKDKTQYSFVKKAALNITSINGLAGLLFLFAIVLRVTNIFVVGYFVIMLVFGVASLYSVMSHLEK